MSPSYQRILLVAGTGLLILVAGWCGYRIHVLSQKHAAIKHDYSDVNSIGNGLLSVEVWAKEIMEAANYQIDHLQFTGKQQDTLEHEIAAILHSVINKADSLLERKPKTLGGKLKKFAAEALIDEEKVHKMVPELAETVTQKLLKPESREKIKFLVQSKLKELAAQTYDSAQTSNNINKVLHKYNVTSIESFNDKTEGLWRALKEKTYFFTYVIIGIIAVFLALWLWMRRKPFVHTSFYINSVVLALVVLIVGLTTPMIDIDARIKSLDFHLMGQDISFEHQVIFFQSKSIVDVVEVLLRTGKFDSVLVGILILVFSIIFPILKLLSTGAYLLAQEKWKDNKVVKFFAFKSGKWSMADVNIIAIFMAYIGFKGILDDQLENLNIHTESLSSISTNETSLQPGYLLFISFVLYGLILSLILEKITHKKHPNPGI